MEELVKLVNRKSQLTYDINCIRGYMENWDYSCDLQDTWDQMEKELQDISNKIDELIKPPFIEIEKQRMELLRKISEYEHELEKTRRQLHDLDDLMVKIKNQYTEK